MNVHFTVSGLGSAARQRALMLVREAVAKRDASLASAVVDKPSMPATSISDPLFPGGGK